MRSCPCCPQPKTAARIGQLLPAGKNPVSATPGWHASSAFSVQTGARGSTLLPLSRALRLTIRMPQRIA